MCTGFIPAASATTISGDVNNDSVVDVTDVTKLSQYLLANYGSINFRNSDADRNAVIDINDVKTIQAYISHSVTSLPYNTTGTYMNNVIYNFPSDEARSYTKYKRSTNTVSTYSLPVSSVNSITSALLYDDDRTIDSSSNDVQAIVQLRATNSSGETVRGTGFIIDNHTIATAAHCLYDAVTSSFYSNLSITIFGMNGTSMVNSYNPSEMHIPSGYISDNYGITEGENAVCTYDYGMIYVSQDLSQYGKINLGVTTNYFISTSSVVMISGFPLSVNGGEINPSRYTGEGLVRNSSNNNIFLGSTTYVSSGESGGPLYIQYDFNGSRYRSAIGIFSCIDDRNTENTQDDYAKSIRVTKPVLRFYNNNSNKGV